MRIERTDDVAVVHLAAGRANAIGPAFLDALGGLIAELEDDVPGAAVMIGDKRAFSAGLDIPTLLKLDRAAMGAHMQRFNATMQRVFELPCPVVAAVNGHAIAGGCVLAMQADERVMVRDPAARIGLNEVTLGIGLPTVVLHSFSSQVGPEALRRIAQQGELVDPEEALRLGVVHRLADAESLLSDARARAGHLASLGAGFRQVKSMVRRPVVEVSAAHGAADDETWLDTWFSEHARAKLQEVADRLAQR
jgi:enoyl-CoA hydratase